MKSSNSNGHYTSAIIRFHFKKIKCLYFCPLFPILHINPNNQTMSLQLRTTGLNY